MPHLTSVVIRPGSPVSVEFRCSPSLLEICDTAVLQLTHYSGSEFSIRIERGRVVDVYVWNAERRRRQRLPEDFVTLGVDTVSCSIPPALLRAEFTSGLVARLVVNGLLIHANVPVSFAPLATQREFANAAA